VKLEELLVEESWLEALPGEFQKDYAVNLSKFVETEICKDGYVYPPQHLIFNALNTTPFQSVKVVILGQVCGFRFGFQISAPNLGMFGLLI
jgi:uracil-DNA glycosylase